MRLLLSILFFLSATIAQSQTLSLKAVVKDQESGTIFFVNTLTDEVDSAKIVDHIVTYTTNIREPFLCKVFVKQYKDANTIIATIFDHGNMNLVYDSNKLVSISNESSVDSQFCSQHIAFDQFNKTIQNLSINPQKNDSLFAARKKVYESYIQSVCNFIIAHRNEPSSAIVLDYLMIKNGLLKPDQIEKLYDSLGASVKTSLYGQSVLLSLDNTARLLPGKIGPDFILYDKAGKKETLSGLKGNYVLLHFWASWCAPCRLGNPEWVELFKRNKNKQFRFVFISLDKDKPEWIKAIHKDNLEGITHLWDPSGKGFDKAICKDYNVTSVPKTYLIDTNGIIYAIEPDKKTILSFSN
ncbi:MAG TPA: TlpA disulfide reductase family protein [Puia sp.]|nr:TlpA disulfide reductase family protein [Puia sp.]